MPAYVYDHPHFGYPVAHSIDYPVGPSSKQLMIVSFIGLLLLFAVIQNTIVNVKRRELLTDVLSARRKRELYASYNFDSVVSIFRPPRVFAFLDLPKIYRIHYDIFLRCLNF